MKSMKIFPLLLLFLGLIPSCCPEVEPYFMPTEITIFAGINGDLGSDMEGEIVDSTDEFQLAISFTKRNFVAQSSFNFQNRALAFQPCPEPGERGGLKSPVVDIKVSSNQNFQNLEAGERINEFFFVLEPAGADDEGNQTFEEVPIEELLGRFQFLSIWEESLVITLGELPENNEMHEFTVGLTFEDGTSINATSVGVQF